MVDLGGQNRFEQALRESEARHRAIVDASLDAIVMMDEAGDVVEFNPAAEELFGYPRADTIGRELASLIIPERLREHHRAGLARYLAGGGGSVVDHRLEMTALRADGSEFPTELTVTHLRSENALAPVLFSASLRDLTDHKQAVYLTERLAAIVESSNDVIIGKSLDGTIESWNEAATQLYGYTADEMIGRDIRAIVPPDRKGEIDQLLERLSRGERIVHFETVRVAKNGEHIPISLTLSPIRGADGRLVGASVIARDISEQKREQLERRERERRMLEGQKLESIGALAGGVAHDFNNLLSAILGNADLALTELDAGTSSLREELEEIREAARRAADLTRELLAYAGKGTRTLRAVCLGEIVRETARISASIAGKNATLRIAVSPQEPAISADDSQLRQILLNLVTNAREALPTGCGTITIATGELEADAGLLAECRQPHDLSPGSCAFLEVRDDGAGIDSESAARVFEPFFTTKFIGRGLGLAAVDGIVRRHGGAIKLASEPGAGTCVTLLFPAPRGTAEVPE